MSVEGVPSVDDVEAAIGSVSRLQENPTRRAAEAVHALYAEFIGELAAKVRAITDAHVVEATEHFKCREALKAAQAAIRSGETSAAHLAIAAALAEPKEQD